MRRALLILIVIVSLGNLAFPVALMRALKSNLAGELFIGSATEGNLVILRLLLAAGIDPNLRVTCQGSFPFSVWDGPAIVAAALEGRSDAVEELLRYGADENIRARGFAAGTIGESFRWGCVPDKEMYYGDCGLDSKVIADAAAADPVGVTALMAASINGKIATVETLLAHGANVDARTNDGATALMLAAQQSHKDVVRALISAGADVNAKSRTSHTALILAAWNRRFEDYNQPALNDQSETVELLLSAGADVSVATDNGDGVLLGASSQFPVPKLLELLIEHGAGVDAKNNKDQTALMYASQLLNAENVQTLIVHGASILETDSNGQTPLIYATKSHGVFATWSRVEAMITLLLDSGADINARDNYGATVLMHSANHHYNESVVRVLLNRGATVNEIDKKGRTALWYSVQCGSPQITGLLLNAGAEVDRRDHNGSTALICAARVYYYPDVVRILLRAGADVNLKNNKGESAIRHAAIVTPHWELDDPEYVFYHLKRAGAVIDAETALIIASRTGQTEAIRTIIEAGANAHLRGPDGATPLIYAAEEGKGDAVRALFNYGADLNAREDNGKRQH